MLYFYSKNVSRRRKRCRTSENSPPLHKDTNLNINQLSFPNAGRRDVVLFTSLATSKKELDQSMEVMGINDYLC